MKRCHAHSYYLKRFIGNKCIYCGEPAQQKDHVYPISKFSIDKFKDSLMLLVLSCRECNMIAGSKVFSSLEEKQVFIKHQLTERYEYALKPRGDIEKSWTENTPLLKIRARILKRLAAPIAASPSAENVPGNAFAPNVVGTPITPELEQLLQEFFG